MSVGEYDGKIAGLYDLEETLGRGHYAVVKLAKHVFTGEKVAVKVSISKLMLHLSQPSCDSDITMLKNDKF